MAKDLIEIDWAYKQILLLKAIQEGNRPAIVELLREIPDQITPDIIIALANYLDPNNPKVYKSGPKPRKKPDIRKSVIGFYKSLCENRELVRLGLNRDKEEFHLVEDSELWDIDGNFAPQWKYPHSRRKREAVSLPKKGEIKTLVCKMYDINARTFDDWLSEYNKNK